ncbi:hypothetical protein [Tuberibacillus sp. Marseille-P3662]|uniref:hypothetical protein n=1 Tax=Tuberibacillus sp. Marseille-P3662 TaxID=1965358 RepID=UPI000A1C9567|nr:hypothetical protein [Tuberibacillus sp. Marseille-P3662]
MKINIKKSIKWSLGIAVITLVLAALFSIISNGLLSGLSWYAGVVIVLAIVITGICFDIIGVAATASDEKPFHAMAADKVPGAKHAIMIARNADRFASFCNDVIGDISGVVSGTASAVVVLDLVISLGQGEGSFLYSLISVIFASLVAALTVAGKAFGKTIAISNATKIIHYVGRLLYFFETRFRVKIINTKKKKVTNRNVKGE